MVKLYTLFFLFFGTIYSYGQGIPPIGQWREHLPWNNAINVASTPGLIICATPYAVFTYEIADGSFSRKSKVNGLNDIGVSAMEYDPVSGNTVIAYNNSNIDIWKENKVINIPDIKISSVIGDKSIQSIYVKSNKAYLSSGLGVIVLNLDRYEVEDTWRIGSNGTDVKTYAVTVSGNFIYAATEEGLKVTSINSNPADYRNWSLIGSSGGLSPGSCNQVLSTSDQVLVLKHDSLYAGNSNAFHFLYASGSEISHADAGATGILVSEISGGKGKVVEINAGGNILKTFQPAGLSLPRQALILNNECWIADENNGLFRTNGSNAEKIFPNSPINISSGEMKFSGSTLWAMAGRVNDAWNYTFNPNGIYAFTGENWDGYNLYVYAKLDSMLDFITVTDQPATGSVFAGSYGGGLLEITKDRQLLIYKQNSALQPAIGDPGSYRVSGLATDQLSNVWISNYGAPQNIVVKKSDGQWKSFSIPFYHLENAVAGITIDDYDQKWIVSPKENGLFVFNSGESVDNTGDDRWRYFRKGKGNGNLPSSNVFCAVKDKNGFIWVGTDNGIGIIQCTQDAVNNNCEAILPIVQQDNFAGYLFQGEEVRAIAVDGANRKWIGTKNGLWLISPDGEKISYRFTITNSPLLDNDISALAINPETGELFIATASGICSFRSTATEGTEEHTNVLVYPNPVPPGFQGTIAIRGLASNAQVKITELDGRLVYQVKALGGQAIWNGKDYKGNRVSSGVYIVLATDEQNREKVAAKIFFIR
jgi:Two component regulator propeller